MAAAAGMRPTMVFYYIPGDHDDCQHPNAFPILKSLEDIRLRDVKAKFPLPGDYHFRFKMKYQSSFVWIDVTNDDSTVPNYQSRIITKVLRLNWGDGLSSRKHSFRSGVISGSSSTVEHSQQNLMAGGGSPPVNRSQSPPAGSSGLPPASGGSSAVFPSDVSSRSPLDAAGNSSSAAAEVSRGPSPGASSRSQPHPSASPSPTPVSVAGGISSSSATANCLSGGPAAPRSQSTTGGTSSSATRQGAYQPSPPPATTSSASASVQQSLDSTVDMLLFDPSPQKPYPPPPPGLPSIAATRHLIPSSSNSLPSDASTTAMDPPNAPVVSPPVASGAQPATNSHNDDLDRFFA